MIVLIMLFCFILYVFSQFKLNKNDINLNNDINLPKNFFLGLATSSFQNEGNNHNNWSKWVETNNLEKVGDKVNMWENFEIDIKNLEHLGINMFRFSIEWSRIQPQPDIINYDALKRYLKWCKILKEKNITPIVTLHHFTLPIWVDSKGSWENTEVVDLYLKYVKLVVDYLSEYVEYWITFNEPF